MKFLILPLLVTLSLCLSTPQTAIAGEHHIGLAKLIDGDTIDIDGKRIRLDGIDTPETGQRCIDERGESYLCGKRATDELRRLIRGQPVVCIGKEHDEYERLIAYCTAGDLELNREMVRLGWAVAFEKYNDIFLPEHIEARKAARGIWRGTFQMPHELRAERWKIEAQVAPEGCPIKGNIRKDRIYHMPWSRNYAATHINTAKGERWFCSEAEAIAAGWRAPYR